MFAGSAVDPLYRVENTPNVTTQPIKIGLRPSVAALLSLVKQRPLVTNKCKWGSTKGGATWVLVMHFV
jgi:hypothetical protein